MKDNLSSRLTVKGLGSKLRATVPVKAAEFDDNALQAISLYCS